MESWVEGIDPAFRCGEAVVDELVGEAVAVEFTVEECWVGSRIGKLSERPFVCRVFRFGL
jgi:hypothetical protein